MLREENMGYPKLVQMLFQPQVVLASNQAALIQNLTEIISIFKLDISRVLDLVLEALEQQLEQLVSNQEPLYDLT